jgi:hypothetical protein
MDSKDQKQAPTETERKKLKLNKETLKDLSAADKEIKGGVAGDRSRAISVCENNCP